MDWIQWLAVAGLIVSSFSMGAMIAVGLLSLRAKCSAVWLPSFILAAGNVGPMVVCVRLLTVGVA